MADCQRAGTDMASNQRIVADSHIVGFRKSSVVRRVGKHLCLFVDGHRIVALGCRFDADGGGGLARRFGRCTDGYRPVGSGVGGRCGAGVVFEVGGFRAVAEGDRAFAVSHGIFTDSDGLAGTGGRVGFRAVGFEIVGVCADADAVFTEMRRSRAVADGDIAQVGRIDGRIFADGDIRVGRDGGGGSGGELAV